MDTIRREPYLFNENTVTELTDSIQLRYKLLVYLYAQFFLATDAHHGNNASIMRPLWYDYPCVKDVEKNESSYSLGPAIIVSVMPHKNLIPREIPCIYEFDKAGQIVKSSDYNGEDQITELFVRQQIV